ncbi:MAG TPA: alpha/beta hydrolase-fold protein [Candidatus Cloacimonadota bacterium]|nr:alpha/beta hydrolase-fold protein [Candidatus Cloacimonadota bacterium]HPT71474.1 alpha/beta hydrolase-fold protein [Candidatus Cloacimonadota bacterium]
MYKKAALSIFMIILLAIAFAVTGDFTLVVRTPQNTPPDSRIFVAGNFNNWNPSDPNFELLKEGDAYVGSFQVNLDDPVSYKITRGSWETVEKGANGEEVSNRTALITSTNQSFMVEVANWRDMTDKPAEHTLTGNVITIDHFPIPQLKTTRRVWIYFPPDYNTSNKKYPTLYLQDGQNVFDAVTSFAGEWHADETMDSLFNAGKCGGIIIVAVDNAGSDRLNEYSPWKNANYGGGKGNAYVDFLALSLKPYIDEHYRTLKDSRFTGVGGSSMGAFIAMYAALRYPNVFGKVMAFSTAFWFDKFPMREQIKLTGAQPNMRIYFYVGTNEGDKTDLKQSYVRDSREIYQLLGASGYAENNLKIVVTEGAQHNEAAWTKEFPDAIMWLYEDN